MRITKSTVKSLKAEDIPSLDIVDTVKILKLCNKYYFSESDPIIPDDMYDDIKDHLMKMKPQHSLVHQVGHTVSMNKVKLPYWMGSMNKMKEDDVDIFSKWLMKYGSKVVISDKLDGISCLLIKNDGQLHLYTRGNGEEGTDISHILTYIDTVPDLMDDFQMRGELIISKKDHAKLIEQGVLGVSSNARNVVSGACMSKKSLNVDVLKHVQLIVYELITNGETMLSPSNQLSTLQELGVSTVNYSRHDYVSIPFLKSMLVNRKDSCPFAIDGIIVFSDHSYIRNTHGNPNNAFAFKMRTESVEVTVTHVVWNLSKDKYFKPVVICDPVYLGGVTITKATGISAKFIVENKIGVGAKIIITRSGDVIPKIVKVTVPSENVTLPSIPYDWNSSGVDIIMKGEDANSKLKTFEHTIKSLNIKGLKSGMVKVLFENGITNLKDLFTISKQKLLTIEGIKEKSANNLLRAIEDTEARINIKDIMIASNVMGRGIGKKTLDSIFEHFPDILATTYTTNDLISVYGIESKTAKMFLSNLGAFKRYVMDNQLGRYMNKPMEESSMECESDKFSKMIFVFTGVRNPDLRKFILSNGGKVDERITNNTTHLITKSMDNESLKIKKARENGIHILSMNDAIFTL